MIGFLAVVAVIPAVNFLSLGILLAASARVAESGRFRDGLVGLRGFAQAGKIVLCCWLWILPLRLVHGFWLDAELIDPGGRKAEELRLFLAFLSVLVAVHLFWAMVQGGKLRHFFLPAPLRFARWLGSSEKWAELKACRTVPPDAFQPFRYWVLGFKGACGATLWLALPIGILILASFSSHDAAAFFGSLFGGLLLGIVVLWIPFLQTRFAMTNEFRRFFVFGEARSLFRRAPFACGIAILATLLFALPLYLLKIELAPREVAWLPGLVFVVFIFPARLLVGWAVFRALRRERRRHPISRIAASLATVPVVATYVLVVWLSQYLNWHGTFSLVEQHAFLVPTPMLGL